MSIKHSWNGTTLTVVSDSGTSAADLKGDRGDTGPRGPQGPAGIVYDAEGNIIMEGYATEQYVHDLMDEVERKLENVDVDLSGYATESYVDNAIQNVDVDLSGYATETYVDNAVQNIDIPETDLTGYATETYVDNAVKNVEVDLSDYATEQHVAEEIAKAQLEGAGIDTSNFVVHSDLPQVDGVSIILNSEGKLSTAIGGSSGGGYEFSKLDWNFSNRWFDWNGNGINWYGKANTDYTIKIVYVSGAIDVFYFTWPELKYSASSSDGTEINRHVSITGATSGYIDYLVIAYDNYSDETKFKIKGWGRNQRTSYAPIKDFYIIKGAFTDFEAGLVHETINPYAIPIDKTTINVNGEGQLSADLSNYYNKEEIDGLVEGGTTDLSDYATKSYVDDKIQYSTVDIGVGASLASGRLYVVYE